MSYASTAIKRLSNEYRHLQKHENRVREFYAAPLEANIFEWHFTLRGPGGDDNSLPYKDGIYHGALIFSRSYPLEPPDILFFTRSGRFAVHEKICSTISSYHKELWQPTYDIALTLTALHHFMAQEDEFGVGAFPKGMVAVDIKEAWAKETWSFKCSTCGATTRDVWETEMKMYPEISPEKAAQVPKLPPTATTKAASATANPENAKVQQAAPESTPSSSSTLLPSLATADATETTAQAEGTRSSPLMALSAPTPPPPDATATPPPDAFDALHGTGTSASRISPRRDPHATAPAAATVDANALQSTTPPVHDASHILSPAAHQHEEERDASAATKEAKNEGDDALGYFTDVSPARVVRVPMMTASSPPPPPPEPDHPYDTRLESLVREDLQAEADATSPVTAGVANDAVAPPQLAQRVVLGVDAMEVSIPLRTLDRAIVASLLLVVLILLRRGLCWLLR
ncbi:putative ubiquitin-conjugating enzyme [Leishmania braziliensis MHOM/BR/75/M2904]|uniref:Ubiquitin-conjugating enzyme n=2 Tax=Leishmania braziliensis TaxID=5660 RepID=A4H4D6_LEIBR|nr:putative ubiquitin-conjugating enzyme [Leishmania braziliensis MHOM/BR/75/M2904]KAI5685367.1 Ubiquitinconjugating enzyme [Leishmania braziliensis]CAJ2466414.1 unnamed protein product [Leishmania braziliensis]CAM36925.1 putative ubiquitin-conjugating enzyme [Leishmania braziliensis MHOM/BR/75/M2904]SYZ62793.1 ubiquitin-conjugating_enzyme_E2 [Leishmania braziliensis MHOM/BR/75/M2904]